jgi:hypothetical protein
MNAKITCFATLSDLRNYIAEIERGVSLKDALRKGDNGKGASGKITAQYHTPMVALPRVVIEGKFGNLKKAWGAKVKVSIRYKKDVVAEVADIGPPGICDINPAALVAMGYSPDEMISVEGEWTWI